MVQITHLRASLSNVDESRSTELMLHSRTTFHLRNITRKSQEVEYMLIRASIRNGYHHKSLAVVLWMPRMTRFADAFTIDNITTAFYLDEVLKMGCHHYTENSYTVEADMPASPNSHHDELSIQD